MAGLKSDLQKSDIKRKAKSLGATLVGFTNVQRYREYYPEAPAIFHPDRIWPEARSVIVMAVPLNLPIVESTPSINYQELYNTSNIMLDNLAYRLSLYLMDKGQAAIWAPRDGYGSLDYLIDRASSSFSQVIAGYLAGLGTIGWSHNLLTPQYGSRHRLVSVLTSAKIAPDKVLSQSLCLHCDLCRRLCPVGALKGDRRADFADMDMNKCTRRHQELKAAGCWPCGLCTKVCPVGADRRLFNRTDAKLYLKESKGQSSPEIEAWNQMRAYGSHR
ncbi:MAG: 4Fe-4S dicluster domain-containing protein [Candidatus Adiutrix sp.]|jgi:epoxyqueuosine reductase QueG|nr:4Fe-4S dicluster domain-containing protein [Candidatus Adiutrix sp.]